MVVKVVGEAASPLLLLLLLMRGRACSGLLRTRQRRRPRCLRRNCGPGPHPGDSKESPRSGSRLGTNPPLKTGPHSLDSASESVLRRLPAERLETRNRQQRLYSLVCSCCCRECLVGRALGPFCTFPWEICDLVARGIRKHRCSRLERKSAACGCCVPPWRWMLTTTTMMESSRVSPLPQTQTMPFALLLLLVWMNNCCMELICKAG